MALDDGDEAAADAIFELFRPPLQSYLAEAPVDSRGVPLAPPFDDPKYDVVITRGEAEVLNAESRERSDGVVARPRTERFTEASAFCSLLYLLRWASPHGSRTLGVGAS